MDLKLKDEITKLLIEQPGQSIKDLAKKTGNYYSYTHKVMTEMESLGLVQIERVKKGKREITACNLKKEYKNKWVSDLKKFVKSLLKDAEVKAAFLVMYLFIVNSYVENASQTSAAMLSAEVSMKAAQPEIVSATPEILVLTLTTLLIIFWVIRIRSKALNANHSRDSTSQ